MIKRITTVLLISVLTSCGGGAASDSGGATANEYPWNSFSVVSASDLPNCSGSIIGRLYYIESTNSFKVCKSTGWAAISIQGDPGMTINTIVKCSKAAGGLNFDWNIVTYSTGDKYVYCAVRDTLAMYSSNNFWKAAQTGAVAEGCAVVYDIDTPYQSGFWAFSKSGSNRTAVYSDVGSPNNGSTVTYSPSDCTTN